MSRLGKKGIIIPEKTEIKVSGSSVSVKGPLGELKRDFDKNIIIEVVEGKVNLKPKIENQESSIMWGTTASHIKNMIEGVSKGYQKRLIVEGIGYKADVSPTEIVLKVGFSHPVKVAIPKTVKVVSEKGILVITGIDKEAVGSFSSYIKSIKKPEPYKGKGIRFEGEVIRRKEGKKTA